jgi:presqualene diphosphate synthase
MSEPITLDQLKQAVSGSSFYVGMRVLPKPEREAMYAIYGFCRMVDDIADDQQGDKAGRHAALTRWRHDVAALYAGGDAGQASFLAQAVHKFGLDQADFIAVIDGMQMDLDEDIRCPSFEKFDLYCDRVASAVGRLSVRVFGMEREPGLALSHHLGRALQFTNVLRDIDEDAAIGRVYLPMEALAAADIQPSTPAALVAEPELDTAARWLAPKAQHHFAEAHALLASKPKGRLIAPKLMDAAYSRVLDQLIAQGWHAPRHRVRTDKKRLALTFAKLWLFG